MDITQAQGWAVIIGSVATAVIGLITAWRVGRVQAQATVIDQKVDVVHDATNSRLSRIDGQLEAALKEIAIMQGAASKAEEARLALAATSSMLHDFPSVSEPVPVKIVAETPVPVSLASDPPSRKW